MRWEAVGVRESVAQGVGGLVMGDGLRGSIAVASARRAVIVLRAILKSFRSSAVRKQQRRQKIEGPRRADQ